MAPPHFFLDFSSHLLNVKRWTLRECLTATPLFRYVPPPKFLVSYLRKKRRLTMTQPLKTIKIMRLTDVIVIFLPIIYKTEIENR